MKCLFSTFRAALTYYQDDLDPPCTEVLAMDEENRTATLRNAIDLCVHIHPAQDARGDNDPVRVQAEEY